MTHCTKYLPIFLNFQVIENIDLCQLLQATREHGRERSDFALHHENQATPTPVGMVADSARILPGHPCYIRHPNSSSGRNARLSATATRYHIAWRINKKTAVYCWPSDSSRIAPIAPGTIVNGKPTLFLHTGKKCEIRRFWRSYRRITGSTPP